MILIMETKYRTARARQIKLGTDKYRKHNSTVLVKHCAYVTKYKRKDEATQ
jgi:hypothetical protein